MQDNTLNPRQLEPIVTEPRMAEDATDPSVTEPTPSEIEQIREALREYHRDLTARCHGGLAASRFTNKCEEILSIFWEGPAESH